MQNWTDICRGKGVFCEADWRLPSCEIGQIFAEEKVFFVKPTGGYHHAKLDRYLPRKRCFLWSRLEVTIMRNWTDICRGKGVFFCFVFLSTDGRMNTPSHKEPVRCLSLGSWPFQCQQTALPMQFPPKISLSREGRADQTWCLGNFVWRENTWKLKTDNQEVLPRTISRGKTLC